MKSRKLTWLLAASAVLFICGCDGGGGESLVSPVQSDPGAGTLVSVSRVQPGIEGTGIKVRGAVSEASGNSVTVNGVKWNLANATLTRDGASIVAADVQVGAIVSIVGSVSSGRGEAQTLTATTIALGMIDWVFTNPPSAQAAQLGQVSVLGQIVNVPRGTSFSGDIAGELAGLHVGDVVRISGEALSDDVVMATRIDLVGQNDRDIVTGIVRMLATQSTRFQIHDLTVNYAGAGLKDFPGGAMESGDRVQISGRPDQSGTFDADQVSYLRKGLSGTPGTQVQVCGYITRFASAADFDVDGQPVITTPQSDILPSTAYLMIDTQLCATGTLDLNEALVAASVQVVTWASRDSWSAPMVQGILEVVDLAERSVTVAGVKVPVQAGVVIQDLQSDPVARPQIALSDLHAGDYVRVVVNEPGWTYALVPMGTTHIERRTPSVATFLQGWPKYETGRSKPTFEVWNLKIGVADWTVDAMVKYTGPAICIAPCDFSAHFMQLQEFEPRSAGEWLSVEGRYAGNHSLVADTVDWELY